MECGQALGNRLFFRGRPGKLTDVVGKFTWRCAAANPPYALLNGSWRKFVGHNYARTLLAWCCDNDFDLLLALGQSILLWFEDDARWRRVLCLDHPSVRHNDLDGL